MVNKIKNAITSVLNLNNLKMLLLTMIFIYFISNDKNIINCIIGGAIYIIIGLIISFIIEFKKT